MDLPFTRAEYDARVEKTKARMAAAGIDVLLATDPANMNYLTGYDGWSFYVHQLVIVAQGGTTPVWIGRAQDANGAKLTTYLAEADIVGYPDTYIQSTERHPMSFVADALKQRGWAKGTIGVEMDAYYYTAACQAALSAALPGVRLADATSLVNWVRVVKSEAELGYMREAARIMDRVMTTAIEQVEPGRRQCDAAAEITRVGIAGTAEFGGDYASIVPLLPTGVGSSAPPYDLERTSPSATARGPSSSSAPRATATTARSRVRSIWASRHG